MDAEMGRPGDRIAGFLDAKDLFAAVAREPWSHDFFHLLRRVEAAHPERPRIGRALRPQDAPVRLGQDPTLAFEAGAVGAIEVRPGQAAPRIAVNFFGLLGPNGPLPRHLTEYAGDRTRHVADRTFVHFLDMLQHRFIEFFYRAWAQSQPTVSFDRPGDDRFAQFVGAFIGLGTADLRNRDALPDVAKFHFAGSLARGVRNADGLAFILTQHFGVAARIEEFAGHWLALEPEDRSRLGGGSGSASLGQGVVLGNRVWDRQHKFRVALGPMRLAQFEDFLPGGSAHAPLIAWLRTYDGFEHDWDVQLALPAAEVPRMSLGRYGRLGWTTWMGKRPTAADAGASDNDTTPADAGTGLLVLDPERLARTAQARARNTTTTHYSPVGTLGDRSRHIVDAQ